MTIEPKVPGSFARVGNPSPSWMEHNRTLVIRLSVIGVAVVLAILIVSIWTSNRAASAREMFNQAMQVYDAPIHQPGEPAMQNVTEYPSVAARGKAANPLFQKTADTYGWFEAGKNARYFAGLTAEDMGDNAAAEADLKKAAGSGNSGLESLAKMALAALYVQTGRQAQAVSLYKDVIAHPTLVVSADAARLALAGSEESTNPQEAREMYAKVKDNDKVGAAGEIATAKLRGR